MISYKPFAITNDAVNCFAGIMKCNDNVYMIGHNCIADNIMSGLF